MHNFILTLILVFALCSEVLLFVNNRLMLIKVGFPSLFFRYQMEREIRHKIKKGDLSEIPKDVLDSMTPSLLAPPKGLLKCCYFFKVLSTVYLMMVGR